MSPRSFNESSTKANIQVPLEGGFDADLNVVVIDKHGDFQFVIHIKTCSSVSMPGMLGPKVSGRLDPPRTG